MADDRNEINPGAGEDEYHFNDEHPEYDMSAAATEAPQPAGAKKLAALFQDKRRILIGAFVFLMLVGVVYKMLAPSAPSTPSTDIVAPSPATQAAHGAKPTPAVVAKPPSQQAVAETDNHAEAVPAELPSVTETTTERSAPVSGTMSKPVETIQPAALPPPVSAVSSEAVNALAGRMTGLEQQNVAILNTMQTKYSQKISDLESQNNQMQRELQDLKSEVVEVKQAFHQLSAILQKEAAVGADMTASKSETAGVSKNMKTAKETGYTVQAIIPGRAWLKSASGDTVTVAEGDTLRGVGRVVRIDPYDGIVNLDTGNKTVTLSYGMGADD